MEEKSKNNNNNIMSHVVVGFVGALVISYICGSFPQL